MQILLACVLPLSCCPTSATLIVLTHKHTHTYTGRCLTGAGGTVLHDDRPLLYVQFDLSDVTSHITSNHPSCMHLCVLLLGLSPVHVGHRQWIHP